MDIKKAHDVASLMNEMEYLQSLLCELSCSMDRSRESRDVRTTVTIPSRWLRVLMDVAGREIDDLQRGVEAL